MNHESAHLLTSGHDHMQVNGGSRTVESFLELLEVTSDSFMKFLKKGFLLFKTSFHNALGKTLTPNLSNRAGQWLLGDIRFLNVL